MMRINTNPFRCIVATILWAVALAAPAQNTSLKVIELRAGMHLIHAEVAQSPNERQTGLMHRQRLAPNSGMLFAFEFDGLHCFWMKNTLIPLSIAFLSSNGTIINIADMQPQDETSHCPKQAVHFALEMNQGWFKRKGFKAGDQLAGTVFMP
ncbi:DUF192 domain-containing protein [Leptothrix ochracea]|uniref:DUF192 domain-containing protein n=1 Tax=Leptothrix ochracea TaxID=735331 RepID=UPI0034E226C0